MDRIKCLSKLSLATCFAAGFCLLTPMATLAQVEGAEFELMWLAAEGFTVRANLGLLDASYDEFLVNIGTADDPVFTDFSALDFRRAPETTFSLVGNYEWQLGLV